MTEGGDVEVVDLSDSSSYVAGVPHEYLAHLRRNDPVHWQDEADGPGFWAITRYEDCVAINRDWQRFSSARRGTMPFELGDDEIEQQSLMMLNMDPPLHTRYRRLVNQAFTPRVVRNLELRIHEAADEIIDGVIGDGRADFVTDVAAKLPVRVIAELLGVPSEDQQKMFDWTNRMVGSEDPEYQTGAEAALGAAVDLYSYAAALYEEKRSQPGLDLMSTLTSVEVDGEQLSELELDLFFLLLTVAGNETTRNLMSGAVGAFFDFPDQWELVHDDPSLLPGAVEEMLRFVTPVMNFRRTATCEVDLRDKRIAENDKVVFFHVSANRDEAIFPDPDVFSVQRDPNPHIAFGGGGPHFCLGANLARLEIRVMFEHLVRRLPDLRPDGEIQRLRSRFINGVKHLPVAFEPQPVGPA